MVSDVISYGCAVGLALVFINFADAGRSNSAFAQDGQSVPTPQILQAGPAETVTVQLAAELQPTPAFETPPVLIEGSPGLFFASTGWSWLCSAAVGHVGPNLVLDSQHCGLFSTPSRIDPASRKNLTPGEAVKVGSDWARSYRGVFSAFRLNKPSRDYDFLALVHGENKNERLGQLLYTNTVDQNLTPQSCASGVNGGSYVDCWAAYNGFISLLLGSTKAWQDNAGAVPPRDLGPILWPAAGYLRPGAKASGGVRHPTAIVNQGFVYIYYLDSSQGQDPGRKAGLRLARMPEPDGNATRAPQSVNWFDGAFSPENSSLPPGFDKDNIRAFYDKPGGRSSELWPNSWQTAHFSVARIRGRSEFLGVEEHIDGKNWGVRLRLSPNLADWSAPIDVPGATSNQGWGGGTLHYPALRDLSGGGNQEIDPSGFYVIGSGKGGQITRRRISIR